MIETEVKEKDQQFFKAGQYVTYLNGFPSELLLISNHALKHEKLMLVILQFENTWNLL